MGEYLLYYLPLLPRIRHNIVPSENAPQASEPIGRLKKQKKKKKLRISCPEQNERDKRRDGSTGPTTGVL